MTSLVFVVALVGLLIGLSKGGLGAGLIVITTPLLSMVMPVTEAVSTLLPMLIFADIFALWFYWRTWEMKYIRLMLPLAVVGILAGTYMLANLPDRTLRIILAVFVIIFIAYRLLSSRLENLQYQPRNWHGWLAGATAGLGSAIASSGAPPFTAYMLLQNVKPVAFVGTTTLFFSLLNALKVVTFLPSGILDFNDGLNVVWAAPVIVAGIWIGKWSVSRMNRVVFEVIILAALAVASFVLLFTSPQ
jgi:hypothetical protein